MGEPMKSRAFFAGMIAASGYVTLASILFAQAPVTPVRNGGGNRGARLPTTLFRTEIPDHAVDVVSGRPQRDGITLRVLPRRAMEGAVQIVIAGEAWPATEPDLAPWKAGEPLDIVRGDLAPDAGYVWRLRARDNSKVAPATLAEGSFHTQRVAGTRYTFAVQADSHLDEGTAPEVYRRTLSNIRSVAPDFLVDLGDTFMTDKRTDFHAAAPQYLAQRYYFGLAGVPVLLVPGNHDGEAGYALDGTSNSMAAWANGMRRQFFANPVPGGIYLGNDRPEPALGLPENYFAFEWGDALFVGLDPYWFTRTKPRDDGWGWTLGARQYEWLRATLALSRAQLTFVFIHHLVGGQGREARGGAEASHFFEWGGEDTGGDKIFSSKRPGWPMPIHSLLAARGRTVVFHGHDHLYAHQERDGVVYLEVPQPGHARGGGTRSAAEYGYREGKIDGGTGFIRIDVQAGSATINYVRTWLPEAERAGRKNAEAADVFSVGK